MGKVILRYLTVSTILRVASATILFLALRSQTYDFYTLVRFSTCFAAAYLLYVAIVTKKYGWIVVGAFVIILFNPVSDFKIKKETWAMLDVGIGILWLLSIFFIREQSLFRSNESNQDNDKEPLADGDDSEVSSAAGKPILLSCASREHILRLNPRRFWKTTHCPKCKSVADPIRIRRLLMAPSLLFVGGVEIFPSLVGRLVLPALGLIALFVGLSLTVINWRRTSSPNLDSLSVPTNTLAVSQANTPNIHSETAPANLPISVSNQTRNSNSSASVLPSNAEVALIPANGSSDANYQETANRQMASSPTPTPVRYETGTNLIRPESVGGRGSLKIANGTSSDAVAKLVDIATNKTRRLVFIQAFTTASINNIGSGNFTLKFSLGSDYDKASGKFSSAQSFSKFDETLDFTISKTDRGVRWMNYEVTLNPVLGGTARTSSISAEDFEDH